MMAKGERYDSTNPRHFSRVLDGEEYDNVVWYYTLQPSLENLFLRKRLLQSRTYRTKAEAEASRQPGFLYWIEV